MNDKTREQIEAMKNQTIGVEIEMNNITREKAARKVAEYFGTRAWNAASEYGYYSWACKDGQGRVWKFQSDVSIYGPDAEKCELVTPILTYDDIESLQEIIRLLRKAGAKSSPSRGCGVHIHIGKGDHTAKTIRNLVKDDFKIVDGDPKFNKIWTDPVNAQAYAQELIKHNYRQGWKLPDMPR